MIIGEWRKNGATIAWVVALFLGAQSLSLLFPDTIRLWNARFTDQMFRLRGGLAHPAPPYDDTVVHIDINNTTIKNLNNFYLDRSHYARVVENLAAMEVAIQGYDLIFAARSTDREDEHLIEATRRAGNVYYGAALTLARDMAATAPPFLDASRSMPHRSALEPWKIRWEGDPSSLFTAWDGLPTFAELANAARGMGFLNVQSDRDGFFRRIPLLVRMGDGFYPSLPFRIVCDYLGVAPGDILLRPGKDIRLGNARRPGEEHGEVVIPIDRHGNMVINFIGPWEAMKHYNFSDVHQASADEEEMALWKEELKGKIVLVSDVSTGSTDLGPIPTDSTFPLSGLHANVIHTILTGGFIHPLPAPGRVVLDGAVLAAVLLLSTFARSFTFPLGMSAVAAAHSGFAGAAFLYGNLAVDVVPTLVFLASCTPAVLLLRYVRASREREVIRKTFEAYFPPAVLKKVMLDPASLASRAERKELTILFSDIKDFTLHSAELPPDRVRSYLNEYFESMVEIVFRHGGTVDKYVGDGLMVFFGDPEPMDDHAVRCVRAAVEMQRAARRLCSRWESGGGFPLRIRIGVHTGEVVVGNMGSSRRLSYTALGAAVNLAQRLEAHAPVGGILLSEDTARLVQGHVPLRHHAVLQPKGIVQPVRTYEVILKE